MTKDPRRPTEHAPDGELRSLLREWRAPAPPRELEGELRRAFRGRRRERAGWWLALAGALALLAWWPLARREPTPTHEAPAVVSASPAATAALAAPDPPDRSGVLSLSAGPPPAESEVVIVEAGQAELLIRLGEELANPRRPTTVLSGAPIAVVPAGLAEAPTLAAPGAEVPLYDAAWEPVSDAWPPVRVSSPETRR